jgi:hypothetical protein
MDRSRRHDQDDLALEEVLAVPHRVPVGQGVDLVLQYFLVNSEKSVRVEVVLL